MYQLADKKYCKETFFTSLTPNTIDMLSYGPLYQRILSTICGVQDCKAIGAAGMIEHQFLSKSKGEPQIKRTKKIWKKWFPKEPYDVRIESVCLV